MHARMLICALGACMRHLKENLIVTLYSHIVHEVVERQWLAIANLMCAAAFAVAFVAFGLVPPLLESWVGARGKTPRRRAPPAAASATAATAKARVVINNKDDTKSSKCFVNQAPKPYPLSP